MVHHAGQIQQHDKNDDFSIFELSGLENWVEAEALRGQREMSLKLEGMGVSLSRLGAQFILPFPPFKWKAFRIFPDKAAKTDSACQTAVCETFLTRQHSHTVRSRAP